MVGEKMRKRMRTGRDGEKEKEEGDEEVEDERG